MSPDWTGIAALLTALGVLIYNLSQRSRGKADAAASMTDSAAHSVEQSIKRIDQLTCRLDEVEKQAREFENHAEKLEKRLALVEQENAELRRGVKLLVTQICDLGHTPIWDWSTLDK